jgi:outer membrane protein OmpA-like peptidoglycan-associated protein
MLVFLLISILVIAEIQEKEKEQNRVLLEYSNVKTEIYKDLKNAFEEKQQDWDMTIDEDLTIKFSNPDVLFEANSSRIRA